MWVWAEWFYFLQFGGQGAKCGWVPVKTFLRVADDHCFLQGPCLAEREGENSLGSFLIRALIPFVRVAPSWPHHLPKAYLLTPSHWGTRISKEELGGTETFSSQHLLYPKEQQHERPGVNWAVCPGSFEPEYSIHAVYQRQESRAWETWT